MRPRRICALRWIAAATLLSACAAPGAAAQLQQVPADYPPCTAAVLAGFPWTHPAFGKQLPGIALRNMSLAICRVAGFPALRAYTSSGKLAPIVFVRKPFIDTQTYAYSVTPGSAVFFAFYGNAPSGEFDRSCVGITQVNVVIEGQHDPIDVTMSSGTCGGRMYYSQIFPVSELSH
jgi:hypothetical protein